ncbi:hypothetical protein CORI_1956 [Campylobacter sp. CCUG 57310]|nr:hypothetical protein CORI_1956 [Campylobacter sp. CCUG 57310]
MKNIAIMIFIFQNKLFISKVWINLPNDQGKETFWTKFFTRSKCAEQNHPIDSQRYAKHSRNWAWLR